MVSDNSVLRIGQSETVLPSAEAPLAATFAEQRGLIFHDALDPDLLRRARALAQRTRFISNSLEGLGHREIESPPLAGKVFEVLLSRAPLFRWLERITGCAPISGVVGALARTHAAPGDGLDWHDDFGIPGTAPRRLAITIALDDLDYEGGLFELRRVGTTSPILSFKHEKAGTVVIFEVSRQLEHRVQPLTSGGPRLVYAGWFTG